MEFLKDVFGDKSLTYDEFQGALQDSKDIKLGNLATGEYINKSKYETLKTKFDDVDGRLKTANTKLEGYDPEWKNTVIEAEEKANKKIQDIEFNYALDSTLSKAGAKNITAVKALLNKEAITYVNGQFIGLNEQLESIKPENDYMFKSEESVPKVVSHTGGIEVNNNDSKKEQANAALRAAFGRE